MEEKHRIVFVCIETKQYDDYYEDDNGNEQHTLKGASVVYHHTEPLSKAKEFYNNYLEQNADNPPYDTYSIKLAYYEGNNELVSLRQFED